MKINIFKKEKKTIGDDKTDTLIQFIMMYNFLSYVFFLNRRSVHSIPHLVFIFLFFRNKLQGE